MSTSDIGKKLDSVVKTVTGYTAEDIYGTTKRLAIKKFSKFVYSPRREFNELDKNYHKNYVIPYAKYNTNERRKRVKKKMHGGYNGTHEEYENVVVAFWERYGIKPKKFWFDLYCNGMDHYDPRFIPDDIWFRDIIGYFDNMSMGRAYLDKCSLEKILPDVKQPRTIMRCMNGIFYAPDGKVISRKEAEGLCLAEKKVIFKPSIDSGQGHAICFYDKMLDKPGQVCWCIDSLGQDFVVQDCVKQHPELAKIHEESVNTMRIISLFYKGEVTILSAMLRMGAGNSRIDNVCAGGIACSIMPDGRLREKAVNRKSVWTTEHDSGIKFADVVVPEYDKVVETVKRAHSQLPYFGIIGWDFTVDDEGDPVLIEYNLQPGMNQISDGRPIFGDITEDILEEVYNKKTIKMFK